MADMSRNCSSTSLVGFSVYQHALGAPLQFVPEMGTNELDDMINAYVPGPASILDKRTAVSLEFFNYTIHTGELFKFFYVYSPISSTASPASSSTMHDSGYGSSFNTSPVMSESQWTQPKPQKSSKKKATSSVSKPQATDFSHIPGFSIMTKDGQDVTNSASRGCKTKEQRDHAHLMRIIKACESCRKKKTRCDPSHRKAAKSASTAESNGRAFKAKKATSTKTPSVASMKVESAMAAASSFDSSATGSFTLDQNFTSALDPITENWEQFIQYDDDEYTDAIPQNYGFFYDPAGYFSPSTSNTSSQVPSPNSPVTPPNVAAPGQLFVPAEAPTLLQPFTRERIRIDTMNTGVTDHGLAQKQPFASHVSPVHRDITGVDAYGADSGQKPMLPYLARDADNVGNNYVDFNLYSPGSSFSDEDPGLLQDIAASTMDRSRSSQGSSSRHRLDQDRTTTLAGGLLPTDPTNGGDRIPTAHGNDRLVNIATAASPGVTSIIAGHGSDRLDSGTARRSSRPTSRLVAQGSDMLTSNAATTSSRMTSGGNDDVENRVEVLMRRTGSLLGRSQQASVYDSMRDRTPDTEATAGNRTSQHSQASSGIDSAQSAAGMEGSQRRQANFGSVSAQSIVGRQARQDCQAGSHTTTSQHPASCQAKQNSQSSSATASDQSLAALAICAAIIVVSTILSSLARPSMLWLGRDTEGDGSKMSTALLPLVAIAFSSLQASSKAASNAKGSSRWGTTRLGRMAQGVQSPWRQELRSETSLS